MEKDWEHKRSNINNEGDPISHIVVTGSPRSHNQEGFVLNSYYQQQQQQSDENTLHPQQSSSGSFHQDISNSREFEQFKDRRYSQKIYVDHLFPSNIRPASVLIGTKGTNHARMQSSGCSVQLRGRGCSQAFSSWSEEPLHLFVRYDYKDQFDQFKEILKDIVDRFASSQNFHRNFPSNSQLNAPANLPLTSSQPNWNFGGIQESQINAEVELLWLFRIFLVKEKETSLSLREAESCISSFFQLDSLAHYLNHTSIPPGPNQLMHFILSCPHFLQVVPSRANNKAECGGSLESMNIFLIPGVESLLKDQVKEIHAKARFQQQQQQQRVSATWNSASSVSSSRANFTGRDDLPKTSLCLLIQAVYHLIDSTQGSSMLLRDVEESFYRLYSLPLLTSPYGCSDIKAFIKSFPHIFTLDNDELVVHTVQTPDFNSSMRSSSALAVPSTVTSQPKQQFTPTAPSHPRASQEPKKEQENPQQQKPQQQNPQQQNPQQQNPQQQNPQQQNLQQQNPQQQNTQQQNPQQIPQQIPQQQITIAQAAPRLMGLFGKFVKN